MKETEEALLKRIKDQVAARFQYQSGSYYESWDKMIRLIHDKPDAICDRYEQVIKEYHAEKLKSSLPSEQEMADYFCDNRSVDANNDWESYKKGFQDVLTLLTKGR